VSWIKCGERSLTSDEFQDRALRAAALLERCGVASGDGVALCLRNDIAFFEASFGAGILGAYSVPINWHSTEAEAAYILRDSASKVLVIHSDLLSNLRSAIDDSVHVIVVTTPAEINVAYGLSDGAPASGEATWAEQMANCAPFDRQPAIPPSTMIYTSGTTGKPKGVRRVPATPDQQASLSQMLAISYGYVEYIDGTKPAADIITAAIGPLYHTAPNVHSAFSIRIGANIIIEPKFDAERLLQLIEHERITHLNMVPIMFVRLLGLPEATKRRYDLSSLRYVGHAAAPCSPPVKRAMIDWWGPVIHEYYGSTEIGNVTCLDSAEWLAHPGSVGRAMPDTDIRVVDEDGMEVPAGTVGEILAKRRNAGDFTYHNDPEKRAAAEKDGLLAPGDVGYLDEEGYLYLCDRKSDMILSGGANIYPAEIEAELLKLPGVADCAVFGIPDDEFGEAVHAVVQPIAGAKLDSASMRSALRIALAGYKIPRRIELMEMLPREDSGKLFKRKLRAPFWEDHETKI
jgi:long-chain acyl-CoA synthetase